MVRGIRGFQLAVSEEQKSLEIETGRQEALSRLKPKELTDEQKQRLEKLKEAKQGRHVGIRISARLVGRSMSSKLYSNDRYTKFLVASAFCCSLAITLHPNFISAHRLDALDGQKHYYFISLLLDVGSCLVNLCACSFVHFGIVNVSFVHAFNALEIGKKAGKESKKYYKEKATTIAAIISSSIAAFGLGKAIITVLTRKLVWNTLLATDWATKTFSGSDIAGFMSTSFGILLSVFRHIFSVLRSAFWLFQITFVKSNTIGRFLEWVIKILINSCPSLQSRWSAYVEHVVAVCEESKAVPTWPSDAIETVRFLTAYSSVFLLTTLLLFNFYSRGNKLKVEMLLRSYDLI
mmetsp:Transcript_26427/g.39071  ORF Transcript_26427/g.39071 Transcript_26427/m.39071 type:complete len:349 (+) Transcript_26427:114-1160(+)|eukprot:CAMPEP_0194221424 /NCGR_PEP_ID=MMETSP0156-20130528/30522_1 /TAXON_ID=33649 /ORGANISM="Thalassionema nitzschioides, Strain L26-B" /LENGTH=348 /DNA_ID=CAMNT_0038951809 /DNA_START=24 /DNA_END=1070 /DNA_ORIENTATION=-